MPDFAPEVSAYIPCYNNEKTIVGSIKGILQQTYPVKELFVVDDCSIDDSVEIVREMGIKVVRNNKNRGRGFTRYQAFEHANCDYVLSCDATNSLEPDFLKNAITAFSDNQVACVFGRICSQSKVGAVNKWRARHLFKEYDDYGTGARETDLLITYGCVMSKSCILDVGNFNQELRQYEDAEIRDKLKTAGYKILGNPDLKVVSLVENSIWEVLERYWRWYYGGEDFMGILDYLHAIKASIKPMMQMDVAGRDWSCLPISMLCPHYCFYKSTIRKYFK